MFDTRRKLHETQSPCHFSKTSNIKTTMSRWPLWPELQQGLGEFLSRSHNWWDTNHCCVTLCCMVCHRMTRLQRYSCAFSAEREARQRRMERHRTPDGPRLGFFSKWKQWEVAWKNYPPSTIYACISCSQHPCGVNLSQPEILPWWNQNQVHKTISVSYSVVLYYIYSICKCIWSNFETNLCQTEQNIGV